MSTTLSNEIYKISQHGEPYLYSISRDTFEKRNFADTFHAVYGDKLSEKDTLYIVLGTDGGLLVDYLLEKGLPYGSRYLFVELPHVIANIEAQLTFTKWDDKVAFCTIENWQQIAEQHKVHAYLFTEKIEYLKSISAIDGYDTRYYEVNDAINLTLASLKHKTIMSLSRRPFMERKLENLAENATPFATLEGKFKGKSCVVLGGGPSLDNHIDWIKNNKNRLIIIAVSRIAKKLLADNITPDLIFSVDPYDVSFDVSKEMLDLPPSVIFVHSNYVVPSLLGQWHGKSMYCGSRTPWEGKLSPKNIELRGPTVTNYALSGAIHLGFEEIYLAGFDLCFAKNGATHSSNSNEAKVGPILNFIGQWVDTYDGERAETSTSFLHASNILNDQAREAIEQGSKIINLSSSAIKLENIPQLSPDEITLNPATNLREVFSELDVTINNDNKTLQALIIEIDKILKDIVDIEQIVNQALKDNAALYKTYKNEEKNHQIKLKLDKAERKLDKKYKNTTLFIKKFGIKNFIKVVRADTDQDWTDEDMEETGRVYYQAYADTIDDIKPLFYATKERLKSRIEELKVQPNVQVLLTQWQKDAQFGRAQLWKSRHIEKFDLLSTEEKQAFDEMSKKYRQVIDNQNTQHLKRTQSEASLTGLNRKIVYLFKRRNAAGLTQLKNNLTKAVENDTNAQWLLHLCEAYLHILNENEQAAYHALEQIDNKLFTEDEAIQISTLALKIGEIEVATEYLEKLANISDVHKPRFATILQIQQKYPEAEAVYLDYLANTPNDNRIRMALIKLYQTLNRIDLIIPHAQQILDIEPDNKDALALLNMVDQDQGTTK